MSPRAADARSAGGAADVPTDFLRSAADWRQGVHSERGKESTRSAARARRGQRKLPQTERGVFAQARLATNCTPARASLRDSLSRGICARFPASGGASRPLRGLCPCGLPLRGEAGRWPALVVARGAAKLPRPRAAADAHFAALPLVRSPATRSARLPSLRSAHFAPRRASPLARHFRPAGGLGRSPITPKSRSSKERRLRA